MRLDDSGRRGRFESGVRLRCGRKGYGLIRTHKTARATADGVRRPARVRAAAAVV